MKEHDQKSAIRDICKTQDVAIAYRSPRLGPYNEDEGGLYEGNKQLARIVRDDFREKRPPGKPLKMEERIDFTGTVNWKQPSLRPKRRASK